MESPSENPFASPMVDDIVEANFIDAPDEQVRRDHIRHEKSIKTIGGLYILGASLLLLVLVLTVREFVSRVTQGNLRPPEAGFAVFLVAIGVLQFAVGVGLWKLQNWARYPGALFSAFSMISVPFGTILGGYFLYLLLSRKGAYVCSDEYKRIMAVTPHVKVTTSKVLLTVLFVLLAILVTIIGIAVFFNSR
ncbi:MAG: hypothetical protein R3C28_15455 [Pirellulaceae bacterium]